MLLRFLSVPPFFLLVPCWGVTGMDAPALGGAQWAPRPRGSAGGERSRDRCKGHGEHGPCWWPRVQNPTMPMLILACFTHPTHVTLSSHPSPFDSFVPSLRLDALLLLTTSTINFSPHPIPSLRAPLSLVSAAVPHCCVGLVCWHNIVTLGHFRDCFGSDVRLCVV